MSTIYLVTGGARSGKSGYAQHLCEYLSPKPIYLATSKVFDNDEDFAKRILKHQEDRGEQWTTIEEHLEPSKHLEKLKGQVVMVDCLTLWLTNWMMKEGLFSLDGTKPEEITTADSTVQDASERALKKIEQEVTNNESINKKRKSEAFHHRKKCKIISSCFFLNDFLPVVFFIDRLKYILSSCIGIVR
jgi:adenosyl cobinamide kinase/adenosyl cobinamide phosphate guanylyltransferase